MSPYRPQGFGTPASAGVFYAIFLIDSSISTNAEYFEASESLRISSTASRYFTNLGLFAARSESPENIMDSILAILLSTTVESFSLVAVHSTSESVLKSCSRPKQKSQNAWARTR